MKNPTSHFIALAMLFCFSIETRGQHIDSVLSLAGTRENVILPSSQSLSSQQITISIWLSSPKSSTNGEEVILSKKKYASLADFSDLAHWEVYDATDESGTNDVKGFVGAAFDGRYIYCSPWWKEGTQSGRILRYDTKQPYSNGDSWLVYDAESEDGHNDIRGLEGAVFDGTYVYFVPLHRDGRYYATVLRYDTRGEFSDSDSWEVFDAQTVDSEGTMKGFVGAVFDGTNIYFVPNPFSPHSRILRFNTKKSFNDTEAWSIFNLALLPNYNPNNGFFGGVFDGRYVYLVPYNQLGTVVRLDTQKDFLSPQAWSTVDFNFLLSGRVHGTFTGAVFDGQYVYFSPAFGGDVVRFDTRKDFSTSSSWEIASILNLDGEFDAHGGVGPTYDGRYVYFPPMHGKEGRSGKFIIYDTQKDFKDNTSWNYVDLSIIDPALRGFEGAVFDGEFVYFLPMNFDQPHGKITRYKSHAQLAFELTYNSSSSSFGSTPGKISFKVGTDAGVRSIFFKGDHQQLTDQYWHHIAVTYDGNSLKLYFDGSLNAFEEFDHYSPIKANDADLVIGNSAQSLTNGFQGKLNDISIWDAALNEHEIQRLLSDGPASDDERLQAFFTFDAGRQSEKILDSSINAVHGKRSLGVAFASNMSAGQNFVVCSSDSTRLLDGFYPFGGVWSGKGVDSAGNFNPLAANIGTNTLTYEITRTFGPVVKKFSAVREVTVLPSRHPTPIISQPGFFTLQVSTVASSYEWLKNDTLQSNGSRILALDGAGSYKVRVSDESGCFTGWSAPVTIESRPEGRVSQIGFATLEAVGDGNFFEWYKNDSLLEQATRRLIISAPGKYSMKAIDSFGNKSPLSIPTEAQFPTIPKIDRVDLFTLETDLNGERFEWYMNDSLIEFNSRSVKALQPGQYRVKVMDSLGTLSSMSDMFFNPDHWVYNHNSVGEQYTLAIRAGEDETVCPTATPFELNGSYPPGGTWTGKGVSADGIFIPSMDVAGTTQVVTYSITKSFGGLARTFASTKRISIEQVPSITGSSEIICNEEQVTLTANGGFPQYVWSSGDTTEVITINTPGEYWVEGQSSESCKVTSSPFMLRAENLPQPEIVHSKMLELESFIDLDTSENLSFIWMRNDTLLHETGAKLPAQKTGHYKSMVKSQLGCNSEFSEPFFFQSMVGLDEGIVLFPNPAKDFVNVGIFSKTERATITITSRRGIEVYHQEVLVHGTEMVFKIDISALHHKFYVVKVQTDAGFVSKKLLVAQGMQ